MPIPHTKDKVVRIKELIEAGSTGPSSIAPTRSEGAA